MFGLLWVGYCNRHPLQKGWQPKTGLQTGDPAEAEAGEPCGSPSGPPLIV